MGASVPLPLWLLLLMAVFAVLGLWWGLAAPLLSRALYLRRQRATRRLDDSLDFGLPRYALAGRAEWLDRLLNDSEVVAAIAAHASKTGQPLEDVQARAHREAQEIVPSFNVQLYFRLGYWVGRWALRLMYWIEVRSVDADALARIKRDACVIVVSNHRSNLDPFMLIYMASRRSAVSYSGGEWALAWPFRHLLHALGFYILRRERGGDPLYRTLLERYVFLAVSRCVPQGLFLEGGLSRDGRMQPLKLGLLNYLLKAHGKGECRDIMFLPVGLNYDRIPEDRTLLAHQERGFRGKNRFFASLSFLGFAVTVTPRMLGLSKPFGIAAANFGQPLSLSQWQADTGETLDDVEDSVRRTRIARLGDELCNEIRQLVPILPISLLAQVFLCSKHDAMTELDLKRSALDLAAELRDQGRSIFLHQPTEETELTQALYILLKRGHVERTTEGRLRVIPHGRAMLDYYRNVILDG